MCKLGAFFQILLNRYETPFYKLRTGQVQSGLRQETNTLEYFDPVASPREMERSVGPGALFRLPLELLDLTQKPVCFNILRQGTIGRELDLRGVSGGEEQDRGPVMEPVQQFFRFPQLVSDRVGINDDQEGVALLRLQKAFFQRIGQDDEVAGALEIPAKRSQKGLVRADGQNLAHPVVSALAVPKGESPLGLMFGEPGERGIGLKGAAPRGLGANNSPACHASARIVVLFR